MHYFKKFTSCLFIIINFSNSIIETSNQLVDLIQKFIWIAL